MSLLKTYGSGIAYFVLIKILYHYFKYLDWDAWRSPIIQLLGCQVRGWYRGLAGF